MNAGICQASIALFTELEIVIEMISIGTLLVFYLVANALIYRRCVIMSSSSSSSNSTPLMRGSTSTSTLVFLLLLTFISIGFSISWKLKPQYWWPLPLIFGGLMIIITAFFQYFFFMAAANSSINSGHHQHQQPRSESSSAPNSAWSVPFMPWPAAISIFLNVFLMTTLKRLSYVRFGVWACFITLFYVLYGVHSTYQAEDILLEGSCTVLDHHHHHHHHNTNNAPPTTNTTTCTTSNSIIHHDQTKLDIQVL